MARGSSEVANHMAHGLSASLSPCPCQGSPCPLVRLPLPLAGLPLPLVKLPLLLAGLWSLKHCSLFCIAHFCTSLTLKFMLKVQYHWKVREMLQNDIHEVKSWIWSRFWHCSCLYLTYTQGHPHSTIPLEDLENAPEWYTWSPELDLITLLTFDHFSLTFVPHSHNKNNWN